MNKKRKETQERRKTQICKVFQCKIDYSKLNKTTINQLNTLFLEAKWFYNYCLSQNNSNNANTKINQIPVKVKNNWEERTFTILPAQVKQSIKERLIISLKSLSTKKKNGQKVGKLKFKSEINSIPLRQYNVNFFIKNNKIRITNIKQWMKIKGLEQISQPFKTKNIKKFLKQVLEWILDVKPN